MAIKYTMTAKKPVPSGTWKTPAPVRNSPLVPAVAAAPGARPAGGFNAQTGQATAAAAAGAGSAAPLPVDAAYQAQMAALARQRDAQIAGLGQQRQTGLLQYGYVQDPTTGAISFDASNPLSQAALMKLNFDRAHTGNTNSLAARGQLYSGALQNAQNETTRQQGVAEDQQIKALQAFLAKIDAGKAQANTDYELGAGSALGDSVGRAADNPRYSPVVDDGAGGAAGVAAGAAAAAATARTATAPAKGRKAVVRKAVAGRSQPTATIKGKIGPAQLRGGIMGPKKKTGRR